MPQAIAYAAYVAVSALTTVVGATAALAVVNAAFIYAGMTLLNKGISLLAGKPKRGRLGLEVNFSGTLEPRRIIYGRLKCGGMHCIPPISTGTKGRDGHAVIVVAGHEINDIINVYFDNVSISDANISAVTGTDDDGLVIGGKFQNKAWIRRYTGTSTQTADYILTQAYSSAFTADFRLRGNAYIAVTCQYAAKVYSGGFPNITADVRGYKIYDPRLDTTKPGGSGSHREDDATTWAYSINPALALRHYLVSEVGFSNAEIDDTLVMTAANTCDVLVNIPTAATSKRWTINVMLYATEIWEENVQTICDAMMGHCAYIDGKWLIYAGEWQTPDVTINKGDWVSPMVVQASANRDERWNFVRGWYIDPDRNWQRVECYPRRNSAYETLDGSERIPVEVDMPTCANQSGTKQAEYEAQRRAEVILRSSRNQIKVSGRLRPEFMKLIPGNTVYVNDDTYGWSSKTFRIVAVEAGLGEDAAPGVTLVEEVSTMWTDLAEGEYNTESTDTSLSVGTVRPDLTQDPVVTIGPNTICFDFRDSVPDYQPDKTEYAIYAYSSNFPQSSADEVWRGAAQNPTVLRADTTTKFYWVRANVGTYLSPTRPTTYGIGVSPMSYGPAGLTITRQPSLISKAGLYTTVANSSRLLPTSLQPTGSYLLYAGNNGTVTFSWQVLSHWYSKYDSQTNTPSPLVPHTVTNNGSQHPNFYLPSTLTAWSQYVTTLMKVTLKDTSTTLSSNNFNAQWSSGIQKINEGGGGGGGGDIP